jgi:replicative DNA helicase
VLDTAVRRELIKAASHITQESQDQTKTSRETLEAAQKRIFELTDLHNTTEIVTMPTLVEVTMPIIGSHFDNKGAFFGVPSGFSDLDDKTGGFHPQQLIIIGARPGMGKTAMALSMLEHIAVDKSISAGFFSLEMPKEEIGQRLFSQITGIASERLRNGFFPEGAWQSIHDAADRLYDAPLVVVDTPVMKMLELRALARNMVMNHAVKVIFVDYITYITPEDNRVQRYEQVGEISRSLKALARELKVPLVVLSQLGRPAEGKAPSLSELRESGNIEQDADVVLLIDRERGDGTQEVIETKLHVAKQRNGPTGVVDLLFKPGIAKFVNKARG